MVRIATPTHSDDGFDVIYDAEAVSDVSDGSGELHESSPSSRNTRSDRLAGPHEVPQIPQAQASDPLVGDLPSPLVYDSTFGNLPPPLSEQSIDEFHRGSHSAKGEQSGNLVNDGLKYTKSVYNKFMSKDALIAVMGYVSWNFARKVHADMDLG